MGEKDETKNEVKKAAHGGEKAAADGGSVTAVVLKLDLHCEGCAKKVRRSVSNLEGVEKVKADWNAKNLTVMGNVDPTWLLEKVKTKTKKKVELISPPPKKDGGAPAPAAGGDKKTEVNKADDNKTPAEEEKPEKKAEEHKVDDNKKPKEVSTVVMKTKLHCDGCAHKIKRIILKNFDGVDSISTDLDKDLITVIGTMDVKELVTFLKDKLKRGVEILPPKKEKAKEGEGGGDKKEKSPDESVKEVETKPESSGEEKKKGAKVEVNKMEHRGNTLQTHYSMPITMYNQSYGNHDYGSPMYHHHQGYSSMGNMVQYAQGPPMPPPTYLSMDHDQMFSDENPNGCYVM